MGVFMAHIPIDNRNIINSYYFPSSHCPTFCKKVETNYYLGQVTVNNYYINNVPSETQKDHNLLSKGRWWTRISRLADVAQLIQVVQLLWPWFLLIFWSSLVGGGLVGP